MINKETIDSEAITLTFSIKEGEGENAVSPSNISMDLLKDYVEQVTKFIKGSQRIDTKQIIAAVKEGSFAIAASGPSKLLSEAADDFNKATYSEDITDLDPVRRDVLSLWQRQASLNEGRVYCLLSSNMTNPLVISSNTSFSISDNVWVGVEKYIYGQIYDLGGKSKANVHVQLENGSSVTVSSDNDLLANDPENRLYQNQLVHIRAFENTRTTKLKGEELIGFVKYQPRYDEGLLEEIQRSTSSIWQGGSPTQIVEALRGNNE